MKAIRLKLLLVSIVCSAMSYGQSEKKLALLIAKSDGTSIGYCLDSFPVLEFQNNILNIISERNTDVFLWKELTSLKYVKETEIPNAINGLGISDFSVIYYDNGISVLPNKNQRIVVYDVGGKVVFSSLLEGNTSLFIKYSLFQRGFYILNNGNHNFKFYVK